MDSLAALSNTCQALLATLLTWGVTALGASLVFFLRKPNPAFMDALLGFGAGVMLASSFWSLLEPGISTAVMLLQPSWLIAAAGFLCGELFVHTCEFFMSRIQRFATKDHTRRRTAMLVASITLHNIPEGLAIGVAFGSFALTQDADALRLAWMLAVGIALQNFPEGAAVSLPLRRDGFSGCRAFMAGQFSGIVEPLSALAGALLSAFVQPILPFLLCFAAGAMISVVISELIPECMRNSHRMFMTQAFTAGFTLMMILDVALS